MLPKGFGYILGAATHNPALGIALEQMGDSQRLAADLRKKSKERRRIAEAQHRYDMAKPGEAVQIDPELLPFINRTEK